jgi:hypothetical protein
VTSCASCGHQLGVGRFCTNCGAPVDSSTPDRGADDWRTDTAERRLTRNPADPRTPPAAVAPPPPPRYPLYADEVDRYSPVGPLHTAAPDPVTVAIDPAEAGSPIPFPDDPSDDLADDLFTDGADDGTGDAPYGGAYAGYDVDHVDDDERRSPVLWILATALVLVLVAIGWWFLVRDDGGARATDDGGTGPSAGASGSPAATGTDVAGRAAAKASETAPPNQDVNGDQVSYDASNMLDGVPETAWRAPGDGTGLVLTFTLRDPTVLHQVGLVNGYAKTSTDAKGRDFDWYLGNRRIRAVVWLFDDGTKVRQALEETRDLQMVDVDAAVTSKVVCRIVKVSEPGSGTAARDFTAISEVSLVGDPA